MNENTVREGKRHPGVSLMNAVLCLCVILIHLNSQPLAELSTESPWFVAAFSVNKILSFAVPAFLFLSGLKLFARYGAEPMPVGRFYLGRLRRIVLPYLAAVAVYFVYFYTKAWVLLADLPEYVLLGTLAAHFYYVVIAVQFYLLFPLLRLAAARWPRVTLAVSLLCTVLLQQFAVFPYADRFFGSYLFYFVLGMLVSRCGWAMRRPRNGFILPLMWASVAVLHVCLSYGQVTGRIGYVCSGAVNVLYVALGLLVLFGACIKSERAGWLRSAAEVLGHGSYAVYLYHVLLIFLLQYDVYPHVNLPLAARYAISFAAVYGVAIVYCCLRTEGRRVRRGQRRNDHR